MGVWSSEVTGYGAVPRVSPLRAGQVGQQVSPLHLSGRSASPEEMPGLGESSGWPLPLPLLLPLDAS